MNLNIMFETPFTFILVVISLVLLVRVLFPTRQAIVIHMHEDDLDPIGTGGSGCLLWTLLGIIAFFYVIASVG